MNEARGFEDVEWSTFAQVM